MGGVTPLSAGQRLRVGEVPLFIGNFAFEIASPWAPLGDALLALGENQSVACLGLRGKLPEPITAQVMEWIAANQNDRQRQLIAARLVGVPATPMGTARETSATHAPAPTT